jgi:hypothetical protein
MTEAIASDSRRAGTHAIVGQLKASLRTEPPEIGRCEDDRDVFVAGYFEYASSDHAEMMDMQNVRSRLFEHRSD